ncbi:hypothetical protein QP028_00470 [Corynebacterium suedekumii]|nr:hypothetical protein QP028_00470 [Corynebacterium suedekumii]
MFDLPDGDGTSANGSQDDGGDRLELASSEVIADADGTGIETSQRIFEESEAVVVAADTPADQERAANIAVAAGAPMLTVTGPDATAIDEEIDRLGADTVVTVGDTGTVAEGSETIDGTAPAGEDATAEETTGEAPADRPHRRPRLTGRPPRSTSPPSPRSTPSPPRASTSSTTRSTRWRCRRCSSPTRPPRPALPPPCRGCGRPAPPPSPIRA